MKTPCGIGFRKFSEMQGGWRTKPDTTPLLVRMAKHIRVAHVGALIGHADNNCEMCRVLTAAMQRLKCRPNPSMQVLRQDGRAKLVKEDAKTPRKVRRGAKN